MSSYADNLRDLADTATMNTIVLRGAADEIDAERALADDLAAALAKFEGDPVGRRPSVNWLDDVQAVLARYRKARR